MASRSRKGGGSNSTGNKVLWALVVGGMIFAFFQIPYDPGVKGIWGVVESKAKTVETWAQGVGPGIGDWVSDLITGGSSREEIAPSTGYEPYKPIEGSGTPEQISNSLNGVTIAPAEKVAYNRDEWNHWVNNRDCWTVREYVLARDAEPGSLSLVDGAGNPTADVNVACEIKSGTWIDPYTGQSFTNPSDLDIDHMIPLKYAATHGGQAWDSNRKQEYANSLDNSHLLAVSASANRSKSDKGPGDWKPSNKSYECAYASSWVNIASKWQLSVTEKDANSLKEMLATCQ